MKRLFVILLLLCAWVCLPMLQAQIYTTSSASMRAYSTGGWAHIPVASFKSTSAYVQNQIVPVRSSYETAPIQVSNGVIRTVASSIKGGKLADDQTAYIPTIRDRHNTMAPPSEKDGGTQEHLPLKLDWDSFLLLALLLSVYACFVARKQEIQ